MIIETGHKLCLLLLLVNLLLLVVLGGELRVKVGMICHRCGCGGKRLSRVHTRKLRAGRRRLSLLFLILLQLGLLQLHLLHRHLLLDKVSVCG